MRWMSRKRKMGYIYNSATKLLQMNKGNLKIFTLSILTLSFRGLCWMHQFCFLSSFENGHSWYWTIFNNSRIKDLITYNIRKIEIKYLADCMTYACYWKAFAIPSSVHTVFICSYLHIYTCKCIGFDATRAYWDRDCIYVSSITLGSRIWSRALLQVEIWTWKKVMKYYLVYWFILPSKILTVLSSSALTPCNPNALYW